MFRALDAHAKALLDGDEAGWLAAVDPDDKELTAKYRRLYTTLRSVGITTWSYHSVLEPKPLGTQKGKIIVGAYIVYCIRGTRCRPWNPDAGPDDAPTTIRRSLVMTERDSGWVIVDDETYRMPGRDDPPWLRTAAG